MGTKGQGRVQGVAGARNRKQVGLVCWSLTSLCHSNGHTEKLITLLP